MKNPTMFIKAAIPVYQDSDLTKSVKRKLKNEYDIQFTENDISYKVECIVINDECEGILSSVTMSEYLQRNYDVFQVDSLYNGNFKQYILEKRSEFKELSSLSWDRVLNGNLGLAPMDRVFRCADQLDYKYVSWNGRIFKKDRKDGWQQTEFQSKYINK